MIFVSEVKIKDLFKFEFLEVFLDLRDLSQERTCRFSSGVSFGGAELVVAAAKFCCHHPLVFQC